MFQVVWTSLDLATRRADLCVLRVGVRCCAGRALLYPKTHKGGSQSAAVVPAELSYLGLYDFGRGSGGVPTTPSPSTSTLSTLMSLGDPKHVDPDDPSNPIIPKTAELIPLLLRRVLQLPRRARRLRQVLLQ